MFGKWRSILKTTELVQASTATVFNKIGQVLEFKNNGKTHTVVV